jgi:RNA polymerase sigma-70 factor (sigma-E family)
VRRGSETEAEFTTWVEARQHRLLRAAYLLTGDLQRAEDLLQDALIRVADRWQRLRDGNPDAYVRTILYRDNISWWRRRREVPVPEVYDGVRMEVADVEAQLVVREALNGLTTKQRAVLLLRYFEDLSERDTARVLGVSVGTVKSQSSAALRRLRMVAPQLAGVWMEGRGDD